MLHILLEQITDCEVLNGVALGVVAGILLISVGASLPRPRQIGGSEKVDGEFAPPVRKKELINP